MLQAIIKFLLITFLFLPALHHAQVYKKYDFYQDKHDRTYIKEKRIKGIDFTLSNGVKDYVESYIFDTAGNITKIIYRSKEITNTEITFERNDDMVLRKLNSFNDYSFPSYTDTLLYHGDKLIRETMRVTYTSSRDSFNKKGEKITAVKTGINVKVTEYVYDALGTKSSSESYMRNGKPYESRERCHYKYNSKGKLIESSNSRIYPGNPTSHVELQSHVYITYNGDKILKEEENIVPYEINSSTDYRSTDYEYDPAGKLISIKRSDWGSDYFTYSENGLLIMMRTNVGPELHKKGLAEHINYTFW